MPWNGSNKVEFNWISRAFPCQFVLFCVGHYQWMNLLLRKTIKPICYTNSSFLPRKCDHFGANHISDISLSNEHIREENYWKIYRVHREKLFNRSRIYFLYDTLLYNLFKPILGYLNEQEFCLIHDRNPNNRIGLFRIP